MALRWWISILLVMVVKEGMKGANAMNSHSAKPRGTVKTIETEYGEVVDCVDIYEQPACSNPLQKNHSLQMKPNSVPQSLKPEDESSFMQIQTCQCPEGTVPIRRPFKNESAAPIPRRLLAGTTQATHKYAAIIHNHTKEDIYGVSATINIWNPFVEPRDFSLAQVWITNDLTGQMETLEAGWMIYPDKFGDYETRLFIYYTCHGFVVTNPNIGIGTRILKPYSAYNGLQQEMTIAIVKDATTRNWWLYFEKSPVGYWPASLFKGLSTAANSVQWGGEVLEAPASHHPTTTQMGSGHSSFGQRNTSAYIRGVFYLDANHKAIIPSPVQYIVTNPVCYSITLLGNDASGAFFYFGGPGANNNPICT